MADIGRLPAGGQEIFGAGSAHLQRPRGKLKRVF